MSQNREADPIWAPSDDRINAARLTAFRHRFLPDAVDSDDVWTSSVADPGSFWRRMWEFAEVIGEPGSTDVAEGEQFWEWRFLPEARLNVAQNLLADRDGANETAIISFSEPTEIDGSFVERRLTWHELRSETAALAAWMRSEGIGPGDRVAAWMPHIPQTIVAFLAAASVGAVFTSTSADFGVNGVVDRFGQTEPRILIAANGYQYGGKAFDCTARLVEIADQLPSVERILFVESLTGDSTAPAVGEPTALGERLVRWDEALADHAGAGPEYEQLPGDHPLYVLYSSGTTGKPKCIVHRSSGVLLKHLSEQQLHCDIGAGDTVFYFTTCGWMMWNWLVSCLGSGATIVLYDGNPSYPSNRAVFDLAERERFTLLGVSAKFLDGSLKAGLRPSETHDLRSLRTVCSTGSPLSDEGFEWVYRSLKPDVHLASMSGGTDLCGCLVIGDPTKPVHCGEIQQKALGLEIEIFDDDGRPTETGVKGELVCTAPFPSMPLEFWGDADGSRYRSAYFDRFGPDVWAHGDFASWEAGGGMVIHGRSDATLNSAGVRIGTAEIYGVVEQLDQVQEAIAVGQQWDNDTRVVLFVRLTDGATLDDALEATIRTELRAKCSPRHVPAIIAEVADIPRTRSGKIVELAVTEVIHGRPVKNREALANPEALELFRDLPQLN